MHLIFGFYLGHKSIARMVFGPGICKAKGS